MRDDDGSEQKTRGDMAVDFGEKNWMKSRVDNVSYISRNQIDCDP